MPFPRVIATLVILHLGIGGCFYAATPPTALPAAQRMFERLSQVVKAGQRPFRILHLGDSHVASGSSAVALRSYLQKWGGSGGTGWVMPWTPPQHSRFLGATTGSSSGFRRILPGPDTMSACTGLLGCSLETSLPGQTAWVSGDGGDCRVWYMVHPGGGTFDVWIDGDWQAAVSTTSDIETIAEYRCQRYRDGVHRLDITTRGDGSVRLLGTVMERSSGIVYSHFGVIGARADILNRCHPDILKWQLQQFAPDWLIIAFGTNETALKKFSSSAYHAMWTRLLMQIRSALPETQIIVLAPPDRTVRNGSPEYVPAPLLHAVTLAQQQAAEAAGAFFVDQCDVMGGPGSMESWVRLGWAQQDRTHLSAAGYHQLATRVWQKMCREAGIDVPASLSGQDWSTIEIPASIDTATGAEVGQGEMVYYRDDSGVLVITNLGGTGSFERRPVRELMRETDPSSQSLLTSRPVPATNTPIPFFGMYYFRCDDGRTIVVSDPSQVKEPNGRFLSVQEIRAYRASQRDRD